MTFILFKFIFITSCSLSTALLLCSYLVHDEALLLLELHFMLISDADARDLLHDVYEVVGDNVVQDELSLIPEVYCVEVLWNGSQKVARAGPSLRLEPIVLQSDEPGEGQQVGDDDVRAHHLKHAVLALQVVHEHGDEQQDQSTIRQKVKLLSHVLRAVKLNCIHQMVLCEALIAFIDNKIPEKGSGYKQESVVDWRDLPCDVPVHLLYEIAFERTNLRLLNSCLHVDLVGSHFLYY